MAEFNLSVGMNKEQVLQLAKELSDAARTKINNFFNNDEDGKISHINELAILNSIFDGTGKVKMPESNKGLGPDCLWSEQRSKNPDGSESYSMLMDCDRDGYADKHNMSHHDKDNTEFDSGWWARDNNLDGVADKKLDYKLYKDVPINDPRNIDPDFDD